MTLLTLRTVRDVGAASQEVRRSSSFVASNFVKIAKAIRVLYNSAVKGCFGLKLLRMGRG